MSDKKIVIMYNNSGAFQEIYDNLSKDYKCISLKASATEFKKIAIDTDVEAFIIDFTNVSKGDVLYICDRLNSRPFDKPPIIYTGSYFSHSLFTSKISRLRKAQFVSNNVSTSSTLQDDIYDALFEMNIVDAYFMKGLEEARAQALAKAQALEKAKAQAKAQAQTKTQSNASTNEPPKKSDIRSSSKKPSILIVDDDINILTSVAKFLGMDYKVTTVKSALSAFISIGANKPDLILLDYMMPICNGKKALEMLRDNYETKKIPIIMLTSFSEREHVLQCRNMGISSYLVKPVNKEDLIEAIQKALE